MIVDIPAIQPQTIAQSHPQVGPSALQPAVRVDPAATRALAAHSHLSRCPIRCVRDQGRLVLQGQVASYFEKQMAQEAVRHLAPNQVIDNQIAVDW